MITLRRGRSQDLEAVQALLRSCDMGDEVDPGECLLAEAADSVVGLVRLEHVPDATYLRPIAISPAHQHQGIGRLLLEAVVTDLAELRVVARGAAFGFYVALGFTPMEWESVHAGYRQECAECPDHEACGSVPMRYCHPADKTAHRTHDAGQQSNSGRTLMEDSINGSESRLFPGTTLSFTF